MRQQFGCLRVRVLPGSPSHAVLRKAYGMARAAKGSNLELLPLFATDDAIGAALLGADRVQEFRQMVPLLEARGFPKIDPLIGGRYVPAIRAHFDHVYGLDHHGGTPPLAPDGVEDFEKWKRKRTNQHS
jgi:hypothetical protein